MQHGMLFHAISAGHTGVDIEQIVMTLREPCEIGHFMDAWHAVMQRHTILRTRFRWEELPEPKQEVVAHAALPLTRVDWSGLDPATLEQKFSAQLATDRRQGFDLTRAPLMRLFVADVASDEQRVVWTFHHSLLDGRSFPHVLREVFSLHNAAKRGASVQLDVPRPYREYIDWRKSLDLAGAQAHWRTTLAGFRAPTPFGVDSTRSDDPKVTLPEPFFGAKQARLSAQVTTRLRATARNLDVTVNTMLQAAWALLLHRYSGESDIVFGVTRAARMTGLVDSDARVGLFINTLPMRVQVIDDLEVTPWLQSLRAQQTATRAVEHTPLTHVQAWSEMPRGTPLFESLVVYEHSTLDSQLRSLGGAWTGRTFEYIGQTNFPLTVVAYGDAEMLVRIEYSRARFADAAVGRMLGHLFTLLETLARGDAHHLKDLVLLTPAERSALMTVVPARSVAHTAPLHVLFEQQAMGTPQAIALTEYVDGVRQELSYAQLNARANVLAQRLRELGVGANAVVGLRTERNAGIVIGILAILKAGAAYLPLDPVYRTERAAFMLEDAGARILLTQRTLQAELAALPITIVCLDDEADQDALAAATNLPPVNTIADLAYVIYTSGSTGTPKGVRITHHNVARLLGATEHWYGFNARDVWMLFHSYAFDVSVWELWGTLFYGGRIVIVSQDTSRDPEALRELMIAEGVTVLNQTPSAFRQLSDVDAGLPRADFALRYVIFAGEALELQSLEHWFERYGDRHPRLINMYGITETTVHATYRPLCKADLITERGSVIGEPIPDLGLYLLDANAEPVPVGVPGEIYVTGAGVGLGYLNRPELTAQRFLPDPFAGDPRERMYRSGDLARRRDDGELEYLGRIDRQVKIRGFRIELGEIEAAIAQHPDVRQVAVIDREDRPGDKRLAAYVVVKRPQPQLLEELRLRLGRALPDYMIPAHFIFVPGLPLTSNGKLDRGALPAPESARASSTKRFIAPRNATEQTLADVWKEVLRVDRVGIDDHFFELGGDSILSIQVITRCRRKGLSFTPKDLFKSPTIAQLAQVVSIAPARPTVAEPVHGAVPLTPIQQWFFEQRFTDAHHWNQAFMFEVPAHFDPAAFEVALGHVMRHHDALRLRYQRHGDSWSQHCVADAERIGVQRIDVSQLAISQQPAAIIQQSAHAQATLDLAAGPLLCALHFFCGPEERGRLMLAIHHLIVDGVSWRVLREDLESAYLAVVAGTAPQLADRTTSIQVWGTRLHEFAQTADVGDSLPYWTAATQASVATLPPDTPRRSGTPAQTERCVIRLSEAETRTLLQQLPKVFRTQINDALLAALAIALQHNIGGRRFRIDLEGHGREHLADDLDVSRSVGWFTTLFPMVLTCPAGADPQGTLLAVRDQLRNVPHNGLSYGLLRYASHDAAVRDPLAAAPPASILFNYLGQFDAVVAGSALFAFAAEPTGAWRSPAALPTHALEIISSVRGGRFEIEWHFDANVHREATIARVANAMIAALRNLVALADASLTVPFTPADFPLAAVDQATLTRVLVLHPNAQDVYPLTPMQRLFFAMEASQSNLGFEQWHFRIDGPIDPQLLRRAIDCVIARHTILRTVFVADGGADPLQIVLHAAKPPWSEEDWRDRSVDAQDRLLTDLLQADAATGFELSLAPPMRIALRRVGAATWHLLWSTHHLCIDGWSWPLVFNEMSRAYAALEAGGEPLLEPVIPFRDYVAWLGDSAPPSEDFWKAQLTGFFAPTPFRLSITSAPRQGIDTRPAEVTINIPAATTSRLKELVRKEHLTLSVVLNAAWSLLLSHYSAQRNVVFGVAFSGRPAGLHGIETMVGPCVNNLPVRVDVATDDTLGSWLHRLQEQQFEIAQHQHAPIVQIQQWANVPWRHRLFDSLIVFQNYQVDEGALRIGATASTTLLAAPEATNYALTLAVTVTDTIRVRLIHQTTTVATADVEQFAADLATVLETMSHSIAAPSSKILAALPERLRGKAAVIASAKPARGGPLVAPANDLERVIAAVWQEFFDVDHVSLDDNFFDLGGHSLLLVRVHVELKERLGADLPIIALLQYPTVRTLARHLAEGGSIGGPTPQATIDRAEKQRQAQARLRKLADRR